MRFFYKTLLLVTLLFSLDAKSFTPESGIWWNPDEGGSGISIEIQDNFLFIALYVYDEDGNPTWYSVGARMDGNAYFDASLNYTFGGTCLDCTYTAPITFHGAGGPITIHFQTETTATLQLQGEVKHIERFNFLLGDETDRLVGEWQAIIDFSTVEDSFPFSGDVLLFEEVNYYDSDKVAEGCRPDNSIDGFCSNYALDYHNVAAEFDYLANELIIVVNDSSDYWLVYYLDLGLDQFDGIAEIYPKNSGPNNYYYPVRGFRTASRSFVETGVGPSKKAMKSTETVTGITDKLSFNPLQREMKSLNKSEQQKILRRHSVVERLIDSMK